MIWNVKNSPIGSTTWTLHVNCKDGAGPQTLQTYSSTGYQKGLAEAETTRFGGTSTGMYDDQYSLNWEDVNGGWQSWNAMACDRAEPVNFPSNWNGEKVSADHYDTYKSTAFYCPDPGDI
jgi:hypothetical protein